MEKIAALESLLFVTGDEGISLEELTSLLNITSLKAHKLVTSLRQRYDSDNSSGLTIIEARNRYQMATKRQYSEIIRKYAVSPFMSQLSQAALETLAIVAYRQPVTRIDIDDIRGVQSSSLLQRLMLRGLVKELGRAETPGRPILYGTSDYFMNYFGLKDINELPDAEALFDLQESDIFDLFMQEEVTKNEEQ